MNNNNKQQQQQQTKFKIIKHSISIDGKGIVHKAKRNGVLKEEQNNNGDELKDDVKPEEEQENNESTTNNNSLKPFIEKIMATPLHFMRFNTKSVTSEDKTEEKYIIIGDKSEINKNKSNSNTADSANKGVDQIEVKEVYRPKSLAESLLNYISPKNNNRKEKSGKKRKRDEISQKQEIDKEEEKIYDEDEDFGDVIEEEDEEDINNNSKRAKLNSESKSKNVAEQESENESAHDQEEEKEEEENNSNNDDDNNDNNNLSDIDDKTPINSDYDDMDQNTNNLSLSNHTNDEDLGEDLGENLEDNHNTGASNESTQQQNLDSKQNPDTEINNNNNDDDSNACLLSPDGKTAVSTPETDVVIPERNSITILKQKLEPPKGIESCSPITLNLTSDHGSKFEPYIMTKNWISPQNNSKFYPKGLINHGVTCYINSAVQAMLHIPAIQNYLMDILANSNKYPMINRNSVTWQLAETSKKMWTSNNNKTNAGGNYLDPKKLISRLCDINCMMSEWEQEDSHEYFMSLMSRLQEDSVPKGVPMTKSILYQIFGGKFKQSIRCGSCDKVSVTEQMFYDLSVFLSKKKKTSKINLTNCVEQFFQKEKIVDGYNCDNCKATNKNSEKKIKILEEPEYLVIHLKKYKFDGLESHKMKQKVNFDKYLDLTGFKDDSSVPSIYQLTSVVCHSGRSLSSGHYIAHTLQPDQTWATYDDDYINKISEADVLEVNDAYYLVYAKLTPKKDLREIKGLTKSSIATSNSFSSSPSSTPISKKKLAKQEKFRSPLSSPNDKNSSHNKILAARLKLFNKGKQQKNKKKNKKFNNKSFNKFKY